MTPIPTAMALSTVPTIVPQFQMLIRPIRMATVLAMPATMIAMATA